MEVQKKEIDKKLYNIELPDLRSDNKDHIYKKLSENLNGCVTLEEWNFLYNQTLLQKDHNYDILEIGSHTGVSTSALLLDAVEKKADTIAEIKSDIAVIKEKIMWMEKYLITNGK